jgi:hypothetical protein
VHILRRDCEGHHLDTIFFQPIGAQNKRFACIFTLILPRCLMSMTLLSCTVIQVRI